MIRLRRCQNPQSTMWLHHRIIAHAPLPTQRQPVTSYFPRHPLTPSHTYTYTHGAPAPPPPPTHVHPHNRMLTCGSSRATMPLSGSAHTSCGGRGAGQAREQPGDWLLQGVQHARYVHGPRRKSIAAHGTRAGGREEVQAASFSADSSTLCSLYSSLHSSPHSTAACRSRAPQ